MDRAYWHICLYPCYLLPVVNHLELARHDTTPSDPKIQLYDQQSLFWFHIPPLSPTVSTHKEFIALWFDAGLDGIWPWLTGQGCGALGAVVQWWRSPWGTHQRQCASKGCTVSNPTSALTGDWIHQLIIKPQISHVFWISSAAEMEQMTLQDQGSRVLFKSVALPLATVQLQLSILNSQQLKSVPTTLNKNTSWNIWRGLRSEHVRDTGRQ